LKFYASVRLDLRRIASIKQADSVIGSRVKARVVKNKVAPPFRETEFEILHDQGIAKVQNTLDVAANLGVIDKSGTWYIFQEDKLGQGREQAVNYLKQKPQVADKIEKLVRERISI
jgi:recombination protein RecA